MGGSGGLRLGFTGGGLVGQGRGGGGWAGMPLGHTANWAKAQSGGAVVFPFLFLFVLVLVLFPFLFYFSYTLFLVQ